MSDITTPDTTTPDTTAPDTATPDIMTPEVGAPHRYRRIVDDLRARIGSGVLPPGAAIPSERALEEQFGVSRITVRRALDALEQDRLIERRQGRATIVAPRPRPALSATLRGGLTDMLHLGRVTEARVRVFEWRVATAELAAALAVEEGDQVLYVARLRLRDGRPMFHTEAFLPRPIGMRIDRRMLERTPILDVIAGLGVRIVSSQQTMSAMPCPDGLAPLLAVDPASPMFRIERVVRDEADRPVQFLVSMFPWDRFSYRVEAVHEEDAARDGTGGGRTGRSRARNSGLLAR